MISKNVIYVVIVLLGVLIALPIWQLSGMLLWGVLCGVVTMLILDITMLRPYPLKMKLVFLAMYIVSMVCVLCWLFLMWYLWKWYGLLWAVPFFVVNDKRRRSTLKDCAAFFILKKRKPLAESARGYASGGIRTHTGVSPTDFESVTSASSITLACSSLLAYNTQIFINCQEKK